MPTDGAGRAVDPFGILDWTGLLDVLSDHGPAELIRPVRRAESADRDRRRHPRTKRHDDASVVFREFYSE